MVECTSLPKQGSSMRFLRVLFPIILLGCYLFSFLTSDYLFDNRKLNLRYPFPAPVYRVVSGYLTQIISEVLFVKVGVFLGGVKLGAREEYDSLSLAKNLDVITELYPEFIDPYYYASGHLAPLSKNSAIAAVAILKRGINTYPENLFLHFFIGYTYNFYLDEPLNASSSFKKASKLPGAPPIFERLAVIFSVEGGNLQAGHAMLQIMINAENDPSIKSRYLHEIEVFERALKVQGAIEDYWKEYGEPPKTLSLLIPEFIIAIPSMDGLFELDYKPGNLRLVRPR